MLGLQPHEDAALAAVRDFDIRRLRRARALRRVLLTLLAAFVVAGAVGRLGGRSSAVAARGGGYELRVTFATVSRPGRDAAWKVDIAHPGGFAGPVHVATDSSYLDLFDQSRVRPEPRSSKSAGATTIWEFDPPTGSTLQITLEADFDQDSMGIHPGTTAILGPAGKVVQVGYRSAVLP